jgi:hypothetical protein
MEHGFSRIRRIFTDKQKKIRVPLTRALQTLLISYFSIYLDRLANNK